MVLRNLVIAAHRRQRLQIQLVITLNRLVSAIVTEIVTTGGVHTFWSILLANCVVV